jgi:uncharacterized protein
LRVKSVQWTDLSDERREREQPDKENMETDPKLLEILVCPLTKTRLHYDRERQELVSRAAGLAYPIRDGVPVMLPDEARPLSDEERDGRR